VKYLRGQRNEQITSNYLPKNGHKCGTHINETENIFRSELENYANTNGKIRTCVG